jgi:two-component system sensor histidine kinase/response regulator
MSDPDPAAEIAALGAARSAQRLDPEALARRVREVTALLLRTDLSPEQRGLVEQLRAAVDAGGAGAGSPAPAQAPVAAPERARVLLVEDDAVNRRAIRALVEKRGYAVDLAGDGREAVEATGREAYAAVLMDCHMPHLDGYEATRQIRARDAGRPDARRVVIIAMTAHVDPGSRERCLSAGMDDYVPKPVTGDALDAALRRWIALLPPSPAPPSPAPPSAGKRRPSSPAVDLAMLRRMRATQGPTEPDIVAEVVALFLRDAPARLASIQEAVARGDLLAAQRAAHTLMGSGGHLGARTLSALCARFEEKARSGAPFDAALAAGAIAEELDRVRSALAKEGGPAGP